MMHSILEVSARMLDTFKGGLYLPFQSNGIEVAPRLLFTFPHLAMGIVEVMPDVFHITTSEIYTWSASHLYRLDLNGWTPGKPVHPEPILHLRSKSVASMAAVL